MPPEVQKGNSEKRNYKQHHEKASFFSYSRVLEQFFCFAFEKTSSLPMLFVHVGKRSRETIRSSRSQMLFKIGVLKNFSIFTRKHLCWILFLIKLQAWRPSFLLKKRLQHRFFPVNIAKFLRTAFLSNPFCSLYFSEILCDDRILWTSLDTKLTFLYIFYYCFVFLHNPSVRIGSPWLLCTCFNIKIFIKRDFRTHRNVGSSTILLNH